MSVTTALRVPYLKPGKLWEYYLSDPVRLVVALLTTFVLGYGARLENWSPLTFSILEDMVGRLSIVELAIMLILALELVRRIILGEWRLERSPVSRMMLWAGIILCFIPYMRMLLVEARFRIPYEMLFLPVMFIMPFVWLFLFRRQELPAMLWMVLIAGAYRGVEAVAVYLNVGLLWGLLTGWRDGMLLTLMVTGGLIAYIVKPQGDAAYARVRKFLFVMLPLSVLGFMGSLRRSFMLGAVVAIIVLVFVMLPQERHRLREIVPLLLVLMLGSMVMLNFGEFIARFTAISEPTREGSAAYRVFEFYNVWNMVLERPIFGWPMGTMIYNYTLIDIQAVSILMPHNIYLYVLFRAGIIGLVIWIGLLVMLLRMHYRTIRAARTPLERFLSLWLACATLVIIVAGFTAAIWTDRLQHFYPFLVVMTSFLPGAWPRRKLEMLRAESGLTS